MALPPKLRPLPDEPSCWRYACPCQHERDELGLVSGVLLPYLVSLIKGGPIYGSGTFAARDLHPQPAHTDGMLESTRAEMTARIRERTGLGTLAGVTETEPGVA